MDKRCWNCGIYVHAGVFCLDCVRAIVVTVVVTLASALIVGWLRGGSL